MPNVVQSADFILLHGNGIGNPARIAELVNETRSIDGYTPKPILYNEDDHYNFDAEENNFTLAIEAYSSWGYFDYRRDNEGFENGFQSVPVDWGISSGRKIEFFNKVKEVTGQQ